MEEVRTGLVHCSGAHAGYEQDHRVNPFVGAQSSACKMKIVGIECHVLLDPDFKLGATSSAQDDLVVEIYTDTGLVGIGEADVNPWIGRACILAPGTHTMDQGLGDVLLGLDPTDPEAVWERLYQATAMTGRRGALIHALGAIDLALWDIRGKAAGVPVWKLLGEQARDALAPYASLQPEVADFDAYTEQVCDWAAKAQVAGYHAVKVSLTFGGPFAHMGVRVPSSRLVGSLGKVRDAIGPDVELMVDVQYAFRSVDEAATTIREWSDIAIYFVETPLWPDDLDGYAELRRRVPTPLAAGEWLSTRFEFEDLLDRGAIAVAQPDIGRVGGLTEAMRVCAMAAARGRLAIPHAWKTGISIAAAAHLATVTKNMPFFEYLPGDLSESSLRSSLVRSSLQMESGRVPVPVGAGLGVELNRDALQYFEDAAHRVGDHRVIGKGLGAGLESL